MLQIIQSLSNGSIEAADVPAPAAGSSRLLVETEASLVSAGTERMLVDFGKKNLLQKALSQPERVREVIQKATTEGWIETFHAVRSKLDQPIPLGYCNAGRILDVGPEVKGFKIGDRVVSNAPHAEIVTSTPTLCARIPDGVTYESAAFTPLAAIGLQGVRLASPTLGENVVVLGLGLVGLLTVQILRAAGCRVLGADFDGGRLALAREFGAETMDLSAGIDPVSRALEFSESRGVDAVVIAAATKSSDPVKQAARMSRQRGRIVLIGVAGLELDRSDFYEKELSFQVSCSYGPGRYDRNYEELARDYPFGLVRWTEQRNFEAVLQLMKSGSLNVAPLITHRFPIAEAQSAYESLTADPQALGIILQYPEREPNRKTDRSVQLPMPVGTGTPTDRAARISVIGAGNFSSRMLIPALEKAGAELGSLASQGGMSALVHGRKSGFETVTTDTASVIQDPRNDAIVVVTRHDSHASLAKQALDAGKSVFVEKPLALDETSLGQVEEAYRRAHEQGKAPILMVGFNRRFAPLTIRMRKLLSEVSEPKTFIVTVNAGRIPADHWTQQDVGGGRIIGEACHFIDLLRHIVGAPITDVKAIRLGQLPADGVTDDKATLVLSFEDGSHGTIHYFANGSKAFPKERIEAFGGGRVLQLDNFRKLTGWGWPKFKSAKSRQDKGHAACAAAFVKAVENGESSPIAFDEIVEVTRWSIHAAAFS